MILVKGAVLSQNSVFFSNFDIKKDVVIVGYTFFLVSLALEFYVNEFRTFALITLFVNLKYSPSLRIRMLDSNFLKVSLLFPVIAVFAWTLGPFGSGGLKTFDWLFCLAIGSAVAVERPRLAVFFLLIIPIVTIFASFFSYMQYYFGFTQFEEFFINKNRLRLYNESTNRMGLTFAFGFSVCCGLVSMKTAYRKYIALLIPVFIYLCWMTQSRSAFFAVAVVAIVGVWVDVRLHNRRWNWLLFATAAIAFIGVAILFENNRIIRTLTSGSLDYLLSGRWDIWRAAWEIFQKSPIFGFGVDSFHDTLGEHLTMPGNAKRFPGLPVPNIFWNAHQIVLGILAEMGLAGLSLFVYLVIRGLRIGFANSPETLAPLFMLIAYIVAGIGGYGFHRSWNSAFFFLSLGLIEGVYMAKSACLHKQDL